MAKYDVTTRVPSGIPGLDEILDGGYPMGGMYLIKGDPGSGKTTVGLHFLLEGVRQGESCLFISLAQSSDTVEEIAEAHEWSLDGIDIRDINLGELLGEDDRQDVLVPESVELLDVMRQARDIIDEVNPQRVVFDSLSLVQILSSTPEAYRQQLVALLQHLRQSDATALLTLAIDGDFQAADASIITDGVIALTSSASEYSGQRFRMRIEKLRGSKFSGGHHDFDIITGGIRLFPRLVPSFEQEVVPREEFISGIPELDDLVGGGLAAGTSTLIIGASGVGKTTIATTYLHAATEAGAPAEIFLFEEVRKSFLGRAASLGMDLQPAIDAGTLKVTQIEGALISPGEFSVMVRDAMEGGAKAIVIDSLTGYFQSMPDEIALIAQVRELIRHMNRMEVMSILTVAQTGLVGQDVRSPLDISESADTALLLRYFEHRGEVRKAISVIKKRYGRHEPHIREMTITTGEGLKVGRTTRAFSGVFTGTPTYTGETDELMDQDEIS